MRSSGVTLQTHLPGMLTCTYLICQLRCVARWRCMVETFFLGQRCVLCSQWSQWNEWRGCSFLHSGIVSIRLSRDPILASWHSWLRLYILCVTSWKILLIITGANTGQTCCINRNLPISNSVWTETTLRHTIYTRALCHHSLKVMHAYILASLW